MSSSGRSTGETAAGQVTPAAFPGGKVAGFDGLRGVAISLVVAQHLIPGNVPDGGVEMFLVLSGYLITTILIQERVKTGTIRYWRFLYRRLLRLYPALVVVTAAVALGLGALGLVGFAARQAAYALTYTFDLAISVGHVTIGALGQTWSLSLEQQFYVLCPLLVSLLFRLGATWRLVAMTAIAAVGVAGQIILYSDQNNFSPAARAGSVLLGCLLAVALDYRRVQLHQRWLLLAAAGYAALVVLVQCAHTFGRVWTPVGASLVGAVTVWVLATAGDRNVGFLTNRVVVHLGLMSYGVFLWHYPLIYFLGRADIRGWGAAAIVVPASLVVAELSRRFVENPFLRLKDRQPSLGRRRKGSALGAQSSAPGRPSRSDGAVPSIPPTT